MIKRALLLALAVLTLALYVALRPGAPRSELLAPPDAAEAPKEAERAAEFEVRAMNAPAERANLGTAANGEPPATAAPLNGQEIVRVRVRYRGSGAAIAGALVQLGASKASTDETGEARISLRIGTLLAVLKVVPGEKGPPFLPYERNLDTPLRAGGYQTDVEVERGSDLRGIVVDAANGRPVADAKVHYEGFAMRNDATTREDGSFEIPALLGGPWNAPGPVRVEHPSYFTRDTRPTLADLAPDAEPLRIELVSGLRVAGRIVDRQHAPIAGAELQLVAAGIARNATSDEHGRFEIGGFLPAESATLHVRPQAIPGGAILGTELELGPLEASRLDLEVVVRAAILLRIYAELADGTELRRSRFAVECATSVDFGQPTIFGTTWSNDPPYHERFVPREDPFEVRAFAPAGDESDAMRFLRGRTLVRPEEGGPSPLEVHVVLDEGYRLEIPPAPPNTPLHDVSGPFRVELFHGAFDVQLLDAVTGAPIPRASVLTLHNAGEGTPLARSEEGWVRFRGGPGLHGLWLEYQGGPREWFTFTIPWTGHGKAEWRLRPGR